MYDIQFKKLLKNTRLPFSSCESLNSLRKQSYKNFINLGFPTKKDEKWKYTNLSPFLEKNFVPEEGTLDTHRESDLANTKKNLELINNSHLKIIFLNGQFSKELSDPIPEESVIIKNWNSLTKDDLAPLDSSFKNLEDCFSKFNKGDSFSELNSAFFTDGVFVCIKKSLAKMVHIVYLGDTPNKISNLKNLFFLNKGVSLNVTETYLESSQDSAINAITDIFLSQDSKIYFFKSQRQNKKSIHFSQTRVKLCKNSEFNSLFLSIGAALSRQDIVCEHIQENASTNMSGLFLNNQTQHSDLNVSIEHQKPHGSSQQLFKALLDDSARAVFNGRIFIAQQAQKVQANLLSKSLMLSEDSEMDTNPELEIFADDVKAAHGATIGQLDEDHIFYLLSRGINRSTARKMLIQGFATETISQLEEPLKTEAKKQLSESLLQFFTSSQ